MLCTEIAQKINCIQAFVICCTKVKCTAALYLSQLAVPTASLSFQQGL